MFEHIGTRSSTAVLFNIVSSIKRAKLKKLLSRAMTRETHQTGKMGSQAPISLLSLPPSIRINIYKFAGLIRPCPIDLIQESDRIRHLPDCCRSLRRGKGVYSRCLSGGFYNGICIAKSDCHHPKAERFLGYQRQYAFTGDPLQESATYCMHPPLQVRILRTCRQIWKEASKVLYGHNIFVFDCRDDALLTHLQRLPYSAFLNVRRLHITYLSPKDGNSNGNSNGPSTESMAPRLMPLSNQPKDNLLALCEFLRTALAPVMTHISISAHLRDRYDFSMALDAFQSLPQLHDLAVNIGPHFKHVSNHELDIARSIDDRPTFRETSMRHLITEKTAKRTGNHRSPGTFPFLRLPAELQQMVLLEAGLKSVRPSRRGTRSSIMHDQYLPLSPAMIARYDRQCCGTCLDLCLDLSKDWHYPTDCYSATASHSKSSPYDNDIDISSGSSEDEYGDTVNDSNVPHTGDRSTRFSYHSRPETYEDISTYSCSCNKANSHSSTCSCTRFPLGLFSVSKNVRAVAFHTFYTHNRFECFLTHGSQSSMLIQSPPPGVRWLKHVRLHDILFARDFIERDSDEVWVPRRVEHLLKFCATFCLAETMTVELRVDRSGVARDELQRFLNELARVRRRYRVAKLLVGSLRRGRQVVSYTFSDE